MYYSNKLVIGGKYFEHCKKNASFIFSRYYFNDNNRWN